MEVKLSPLRDLPAPFRFGGDHVIVDLARARVVFTTRRGGSSTGPYAALNMGTTVGPQPEDVIRNRRALEESHGVVLAWGHQVHGTRVVAAAGPDALEQADGQATTVPGVAATVMVADCLPVAVAGQGAVAMLHAGWRGLAAGIIAEGVKRLRELGVRGPLTAAIGPGAGGCCYEVGEEVHAAFAGGAGGDEAPGGRGRNLDLKAIAALQLGRAGVERIHDVGLCTMCSDSSLFFSHRRDRGVTGRQAGLAWLV